MKKIVLGMTLAIAAVPALATKARLIALGEEITGSQYISDSRNMFLNAAHVNNYKNSVIFELGGDGTGAKNDTDSNAQAEGGAFYGWNNMTFGLYLGAESAQAYEARQVLNVSNRLVHQDNQIDVFVGGDAGIKWGANLTYQKNDDDNGDIENNSLSARLGVAQSNWEAFANISLANKFEGDLDASGTDEEFEGKLGFELGGSLQAGPGKVFAFWRHTKWEQESDVAIGAGTGSGYQGKADVGFDKYIVGYGAEEKVSDKSVLFWKASYVMNKRKIETDADGDGQLDDYLVPVVMGLEHNSTEWLTLRGSITYNLLGQADNDYDNSLLTSGRVNAAFTNAAAGGRYPDGKRTFANNVNVNTGATVHFGDFSVDGLVGTTNNAGTAANTDSEVGVLSLDRLMTRVSMSYKW